MWLRNGDLYECFSSADQHTCVVPFDLLPPPELDDGLEKYRIACRSLADVKHPGTGSLVLSQRLCDVMFPIDDDNDKSIVFQRYRNCGLPSFEVYDAWYELGRVWCTMEVMCCEAGTVSNESGHALLPDYCATDNASADYSTMLMLNGAVASNTNARRKRGVEQDCGHHEMWLAWLPHNRSTPAAVQSECTFFICTDSIC